MKVLIDTNVLFSAVYRRGSTSHQAYNKAVNPPYHCLICDQSLDELTESFIEKFPDRSDDLKVFILDLLSITKVIPVPKDKHPLEAKLRDPDDALILRAAIAANTDIIISGDLDFLESNITQPMIISASQFLLL